MASKRTNSYNSLLPAAARRPSTRIYAAEGTTKQKWPTITLKRQKLGQSDLEVSEASLGVMMFGSQVEEKPSHDIISRAWDHGVNFFDTSEAYSIPPRKETTGNSSRILGNWIKKFNVKREDVIIASKVAGYAKKDMVGFIAAARTDPPSELADLRLDAKSIKAATEAELRRFNTDYIDLMQTHWPDRYIPTFGAVIYDPAKERDAVPFEEQIIAMDELIKEGKIRYWGLSNETSFGVMSICHMADKLGCARPISIQNSFSLIDRRFESELAEVCYKRNLDIPLLPWSALAGGVLSGKYLDGKNPEGARMSFLKSRYERFVTDKVAAAVAEYVKIAEQFDLTPVQLAYLFCKSRFYVGSTIIGATSVDQLEENLSCFDKDLPEEAIRLIDQVHQNNPNPQNRYV